MRRVPLVALICLALASAPALADTINTKIAKKHYELGEQLYKASNYAKALVEFKKAYELAGAAGLLFNIARCYEVMAELESAIEYYRRYLEKNPAAKNKDLVKVRLRNLNDRLLKKKRDQEQQPAEDNPAGGVLKPEVGSPLEEAAPQEPVDRSGGGSWKRTAGWVTLGVGGASLVTGVIFGALAKGKSDDYTDGVAGGQDFVALDAIDADGKRFETLQLVTLIIGGVAAAAGGGLLLWHYLGGKKQESAAMLAPIVSADSAGLGLTGRFW